MTKIQLERTEVLQNMWDRYMNGDLFMESVKPNISDLTKGSYVYFIYEELSKRKNELRTKKLKRIIYEYNTN